MNQIPFTVTVDTEEEWDWSGPFPVRDYSVNNIRQLPRFQDLCAQYGVRPTYFVNHAVLEDSGARDVISGFSEDPGVEIGMHLHPWNTPPIVSSQVDPQDSFTHNLPPELQTAKLQTTWDAFVAAGLHPTSFRGGRYSSGPVVQEFLVDHGFSVDSSICPFTTWPDPGAPDFSRYSLDPQKTEISPQRHLWEIPLTMTASRRPVVFWMSLLQWCDRPVPSRFRLVGLLNRLKIVSRIWLNFEFETFAAIQQLLACAPARGLPHLTFTVHSSSLSPGPGPYCRTAADADRIFGVIEHTFRLLQDSPHFVPLTMTQLADHFDEVRHHESIGNQPAR